MTHLYIGPLVRAIGATHAVIWAEFAHSCTVTLSVRPYNEHAGEMLTAQTHTITIGGHHYAAPYVQGLQPATWYAYTLDSASSSQPSSPLIQCFRTLAQPSLAHPASLRLAYGSCRKLDQPTLDTLNAFGSWLINHLEQRESLWPHVLLLIGDQIYADLPPKTLRETHPRLRHRATSFEDFALLYRNAWTCSAGIRQVLATIPTFMIFDDHEIMNRWNSWPTWRVNALQHGHEQLLVDGLVAYWVYQGWGNLLPHEHPHHPLLQLMQAAIQSGEDILPALRDSIRSTIYGQSELPWHYTISTTPSIFVTNTRTDRTAILPKHPSLHNAEQRYAPTRIMSAQQMDTLRGWMNGQSASTSIIVSSVPVLLPPVIGLAEYLMGVRLWQHSIAPLRHLGRQFARLQQRIAIRASFDHWPLYASTWHTLVQFLSEHPANVLVLSGDVHFSYAVAAHPSHSSSRLYQLVSSPFQNALSPKDRLLITWQSLITRLTYGKLHTRVLPLQPTSHQIDTHRNLLFENTLALVTLQLDEVQQYHIQQDYFGLVNGRLEVIGRTALP